MRNVYCISSPCFEAWRGFTIPLENEKGETKSDEIVEIDAMSMMDRGGGYHRDFIAFQD